MSTMIQYVLYLAILVVLAIPLGAYIKNVMSGEKTFLSKVLTPCENLIYKVMRVDREEQMTWKKYAVSVLTFSGVGLVFLFLLQLVQGVLPGNPQHLSGVKWDLAFNTSASFITNTNWQAYSGESTLSYLTQALGLTVQNFVSAATGIAVLFALIRGFIKVKSSGLGSFWVDLTRIVVHILLPLNLVISLLLVGGGVIQNLKSAETVSLVEPIAVSAEGEILEDAVIDLDTETVTVDGEIVSNAQIVTEQFVPMGPAASQVAIKQTGTNGGGYMGVNSAHPLENPNAFTNLIEMISILLIPAALCFTFGSAVKNKKQGVAIFMAMFLCLVVALGCIAVTEQVGTPQLAQNGAVNMSMAEQAGGNMEGKETRFGIAGSSTWAAFTTAASNGAVNSMHDSYTPLGGIGNRKVQELRTYDIEKFYATLAKTPCGQYVHGVKQKLSDKQKKRLLSSTSIHEVHTLLKTAFSYAVEWDLIHKIPLPRDAPKVNIEERTIWDEKTMLAALQTIENPALHLAVHMSMILSLREGEILGLQPSDLDFDAADGRGTISVNKTMQRANKDALEKLDPKQVYYTFPDRREGSKSSLILKKLKTKKSNRILYMTKPLKEELQAWLEKLKQDEQSAPEKYSNCGQLFRLPDGLPIAPELLTKWYRLWRAEHPEFEQIVFHGLRHSSATYQLLQSDGDFKSVQGNTGHATASVLMDTYAHTQDKPRLELTEKIEANFYSQDLTPAAPQPRQNEKPAATKISGREILEAIRLMDADERRELTRALFA